MTDEPTTAPDRDISELSFEQALAELEKIVGRLEQGDVPLAESIDHYERGDRLRKHCEQLLKRAETRVEKITLDADGRAVGTEPLDVD